MADEQAPTPRRRSARGLPGWLRAPLAVLALCLLSLAVLRAPPRHVALPTTPVLASMSDLGSWSRSLRDTVLLAGDRATLRLQARPGQLVYAFRGLRSAEPLPSLRVSAELRGENLATGGIAGGAGQLLALTLDRERRRVAHWPYRVGAVDGSSDWRDVRLLVPGAEHIAVVQVVAFVSAASGAMELRDLRVEAVEERTVFRLARYLLLAAWCATGAWCAWRLLARGRRRLSRTLLALSASLALLAGLAPPPQLEMVLKSVLFGSQDALYELAALLGAADDATTGGSGEPATRAAAGPGTPSGPGAGAPEETGDEAAKPASRRPPAATAVEPRSYWVPPSENRDKRAHLAGFALLGLLAAVAFRSRPAWRVLPAVAMLAMSIETLQGFTVMREPDPLDLRADLLGALAGVLTAWLAGVARRLLARRRR